MKPPRSLLLLSFLLLSSPATAEAFAPQSPGAPDRTEICINLRDEIERLVSALTECYGPDHPFTTLPAHIEALIATETVNTPRLSSLTEQIEEILANSADGILDTPAFAVFIAQLSTEIAPAQKMVIEPISALMVGGALTTLTGGIFKIALYASIATGICALLKKIHDLLISASKVDEKLLQAAEHATSKSARALAKKLITLLLPKRQIPPPPPPRSRTSEARSPLVGFWKKVRDGAKKLFAASPPGELNALEQAIHRKRSDLEKLQHYTQHVSNLLRDAQNNERSR